MKIPITVKQALTLAQAGDSDAMIVLLKKYQPLISTATGKALAYGVETDDLESALLIDVISMLQNFNVSMLNDEQ